MTNAGFSAKQIAKLDKEIEFQTYKNKREGTRTSVYDTDDNASLARGTARLGEVFSNFGYGY